ncbi:DUF6473 family protein [Pseudoruegeria sp. SHC-113]|uniref:DUF6473 family protein n=1 Tax=Pseudoruegeria sp. SHC-113 TaxID=2855439 RepID=UPI0021BACE5B|nr:DUF6473 family protein [Pseudoruegeria sp. SHC-113]MCT8159289.1 hypothetical protein [Pseudoruegeria sp. SHC-113]
MVGKHSEPQLTQGEGLGGASLWLKGQILEAQAVAPHPEAHVVFLGGTLTAGHGVAHPFAQQVGALLERPVARFGLPNAGVDALLALTVGLEAARAARITVVETPGLHGLNNRFYHVHRKRNDRFVAALPPLIALYPRTDFTGINFVGHLTRVLQHENAAAYERVEAELRLQWAARMAELIGIAGPEVLLLTLRAEDPAGPRGGIMAAGVTPQMLTALSLQTGAQLLECILPEPKATPYSVIPGAFAHDLIATRLQFTLETLFDDV